MKAGPAAAVEWVNTSLPLDRAPIDPESLLVEIALSHSWCSSKAEAQERAESWRARFVNRLRFQVNDLDREARMLRYEFNGSREDWIQGSCHIESENSQELQASKSRRMFTDDYLVLMRDLSGRQFEAVCRGVLDLIGCSDPVLTPRANDQGIDFFGQISMKGRLNMKYEQVAIDRSMAVWIVGQAKQVAGKVSTPEVRDLIGAVELARHHISADQERALSGLGMRPFDAVWRIFVTTGEFSRDARNLINDAGLLGYDGLQIATLLADHEVADPTCDTGVFHQWLDEQLAAPK